MIAARKAPRFLCRLADIPEGMARGFPMPQAPYPRAIFVVRLGRKVYGYWNRCPHQGTPLDWTPNQFFDFEKTHLQCATHAARFRPDDGFCVAGPCKGKALEPVALRVKNERIYLDS